MVACTLLEQAPVLRDSIMCSRVDEFNYLHLQRLAPIRQANLAALVIPWRQVLALVVQATIVNN